MYRTPHYDLVVVGGGMAGTCASNFVTVLRILEKRGLMTAIALVSGGAGFVGSHVAAQLQQAGHDVVVLDDLNYESTP